MLPADRLPPELWLIILDLARGSSIGPRQYCNYLTFPHLNDHLRRPSEYTFTIDVWPRSFRLTCRYFNSLLEQPPPFFMKDADSAIPDATRMLYILPQRDPGPQACFQRLLADPSIASRITLLNLPGYGGSIHLPSINFDFLCDNAHCLPSVRSLALCGRLPGTGSTPQIPRFWWRLNKAFPLLTTLVLHGRLSTTHPDAKVVFEHVEVMDWDLADHHPMLQFPALRHASFSIVYYQEIQRLAHRPYLESLVVRDFIEGTPCQLSLFPNLRLLGLPAQRIDAFSPLPPDHPLQHLYVFVGTRPRDDHNQHLFRYDVELKWLKKTIERMPTITRLSLCFGKCRQNQLNWISGYFRKEDLLLLGFTQRDIPYADYENGYHTVLQRVKAEPPPEEEGSTSGEPVPRRRGFRVGWNKFVQSTSRKLHL